MVTQSYAVIATIQDARTIPKLETKLKDHAKIRSIHYLTSPDKNNWPQITIAIYMIETETPRTLKITLTSLEQHRKIKITLQKATN